jgi:hypothetical protein
LKGFLIRTVALQFAGIGLITGSSAWQSETNHAGFLGAGALNQLE